MSLTIDGQGALGEPMLGMSRLPGQTICKLPKVEAGK
jgi:hypothetical protein